MVVVKARPRILTCWAVMFGQDCDWWYIDCYMYISFPGPTPTERVPPPHTVDEEDQDRAKNGDQCLSSEDDNTSTSDDNFSEGASSLESYRSSVTPKLGSPVQQSEPDNTTAGNFLPSNS